jgi:WD40 repeat protein
MFGRMLLAGILGIMIAGTVIWGTGMLPVVAQDGAPPDVSPASDANKPAPVSAERKAAGAKQPAGRDLYARANPVLPPQTPPPPKSTSIVDPIVIPNARLALIRKEEVPAQRDGALMFVGIEVKPGEQVAADEKLPAQIVPEGKVFRRLREGDEVKSGELIGLVDDSLAKAEIDSKKAKLAAAEADKTESEKTRDEALQRWKTQQKLFALAGGRGAATSEEEMRAAELTYKRYLFEVFHKIEDINVAKADLKQATKMADIHEVRSKIPGRVKTIYKQPGESVKNLESVIQVQNYDSLRAEGFVDAQYARDLREGMEVAIEPTERENAERIFSGPRLDIRSVAFSKDPQDPLVVAGSEDGTTMVWSLSSKQPRQIFVNPSGVAVRAVACTPSGAETNLCLTGSSDGVARIWNLDDKAESPVCRELAAKHRGAIHCVAFTPDGKTCATGGDDNAILLFDVASGNLLYEIPAAHRHFVTSLNFTPKSQLVSVGRDPAIKVWRLGESGAEQIAHVTRQGSEVDQVSISPDGEMILDQHGNEMRLLTIPRFIAKGFLHNTSPTSMFRTLALFSPDSRFVLTTSADGVLQLWRLSDARNYEFRQLVAGDRSAVGCAAFAPNGSFVASGIRGKVYVWRLPPKGEADMPLMARIQTVERSLESVEGKVRIIADFKNPPDRPLMPGDVVTVVAYPQK